MAEHFPNVRVGMTERESLLRARYRTVVADPPWAHNDGPLGRQREVAAGSFLTYPTMSVDAIAALPVGDFACPGAHLYLWTTNRFLWDAPRVFSAWGFTPATTIVWCKAPMGLGGGSEAFANTTEFVVWGRKRFGDTIKRARERLGLSQADLEFEVRGRKPARANGRRDSGLVARWEEDSAWPNPEHLQALADILGWESQNFAGAPRQRWHSTWFSWQRGSHSTKPDAFLDLVEATSPGPYLEMFARRQRFGWDTWGDEALNHVEVAG